MVLENLVQYYWLKFLDFTAEVEMTIICSFWWFKNLIVYYMEDFPKTLQTQKNIYDENNKTIWVKN